MVRSPRHGTILQTRPSPTRVDFKIDYMRVQGPARNRLRERFGAEMKNFLVTLPYALDSIARIGMANDIGTRSRNEDSAVAMLAHFGDDNTPLPVILAGVADGIGGANDGDLASAIALQTLTENIVDEMFYAEDHKREKLLSASNIEDMLMEAVSKAHTAIKAETDGGGSTLTCALIIDSNAYLAHVGDSRAYLLSTKRRDVEIITRDHRLVREWEALGILSAEDAAHHPQSHVLHRSLGRRDQCEVDLTRRNLTGGSRLLLCTDGVSDVLNQNEIYKIVIQSDQPDEACERLINAAVAHNTHDDVTAVLVEMPE